MSPTGAPLADNPYSESNFKTLKYRPDFPERFGCIQLAREHVTAFVAWYNGQHHHSGIGFLTPEVVHYGRAAKVLEARQAVLLNAQRRHPERFVHGAPTPKKPPTAAWINPPKEQTSQTGLQETALVRVGA